MAAAPEVASSVSGRPIVTVAQATLDVNGVAQSVSQTNPLPAVLAEPGTYQQANTNGTPVTTATTAQLFPAAGAGLRNYLVNLHVFNTGAAGTGIQILDGATVIWDGQIGANGQALIHFIGTPLRGTANTAMSIKTVLGTTISVNYSAQGYVAP
jgi:hypothetical protein